MRTAPEKQPNDPDAARLAALVLKYFDALPRRQRQIFELSDVRGWSPAEIAHELGMQQVTVRGAPVPGTQGDPRANARASRTTC